MSTVSRAGQGDFGASSGAIDVAASPAGVAGITTVAILIISLVAMYGGGNTQRFLLTFSLAAILYASLINAPIIGIPLSMIYLSTFSVAKRYLIPILGYNAYDPLVLVQPVVIGVFFSNLVLRRSIPFDTLLSRLVGITFIIMIAEMLNPQQGGINISLSGALFYISPLLWFYAGRVLGNYRITRVFLNLIIFTSVLGVMYGLWQQFVGFSDIEKQWLELTNNDSGQYISNGVMRVFSFYSAFSEYTGVASVASIIAFAFFLRNNRLAIIPWLILMAGIILSSSRGALLGSLLGASLVWGIQGKNPRVWLPRLVLSLFLGIALLVSGLNQVKETDTANDTADALLQWQARGILKVTDSRESTGVVHSTQVLDAFIFGFTHPLGTGLGTTTIAGIKFGVHLGKTSENDLGNMFISCGVFGGLTYGFLIVWTVWRVVYSWHTRRDTVSLAMVGVLLTTPGMWLIGARYSECMMIWYLIGYLDRLDFNEDRQKKLLAAKEKEAKEAALASEATESQASVASVPEAGR